jgi:hypothetical protein
MLISVIAVLEPLSYRLDASVSWEIVSAIQTRIPLFVIANGGAQLGQIVGVSPLLQPIRVKSMGQEQHLMFMKALIKVADQPPEITTGQLYSIQNGAGANVLSLWSCAEGVSYAKPFLALASQFQSLDESSLNAIERFVANTTSQLWSDDPINQTTDRLWLSPSGEFVTRSELVATGVGLGQLVLEGGEVVISSGLPAPVGTYTFAKWRGAGKANILPLGGSGSMCTNGTPAYTYSSGGDGYVGYYDAGGDEGDGGGGDGSYGDGDGSTGC